VLLAFTAIAVFIDFTQPSGCAEMCDLTLDGKLFFAAVTVGMSAGLIAVARWHVIGRAQLFLGMAANLLGAGAEYVVMGGAAGGDPTTPIVYQFWSALPLAVWPGVAAVATVAVGLLSRRLPRNRVLAAIWTALCVVVTVGALTYILPPSDPRVAALHDEGIVVLPAEAGWMIDSSGHTIVRDHDPMIGLGHGYEITLLAGRWTITEMCVSTTTSYPNRIVQVNVRPGETTTVPMTCMFDRG
jgi:hypothetical protein